MKITVLHSEHVSEPLQAFLGSALEQVSIPGMHCCVVTHSLYRKDVSSLYDMMANDLDRASILSNGVYTLIEYQNGSSIAFTDFVNLHRLLESRDGRMRLYMYIPHTGLESFTYNLLEENVQWHRFTDMEFLMLEEGEFENGEIEISYLPFAEDRMCWSMKDLVSFVHDVDSMFHDGHGNGMGCIKLGKFAGNRQLTANCIRCGLDTHVKRHAFSCLNVGDTLFVNKTCPCYADFYMHHLQEAGDVDAH